MGEAGRPRKEFNLRQVETMGTLQAPYSLVAEHFDCSKQTILNKMNEKGDFFDAYQKGVKATNTALASKQIEVALCGSIPMLIWLGKNRLEQMEPKDRLTIEEIEIIKKEIGELRDKMDANASKAA